MIEKSARFVQFLQKRILEVFHLFQLDSAFLELSHYQGCLLLLLHFNVFAFNLHVERSVECDHLVFLFDFVCCLFPLTDDAIPVDSKLLFKVVAFFLSQ